MLKKAGNSVRTDPILPHDTKLGPVHIAVTNAEAGLSIWRDVVGLRLIDQTDDRIHLGVGDLRLIALETDAQAPVKQRATGLYHVAIHVPTRADLARFAVRAIEAGVRIAPTDHLVTEAIYAWDRDGNGIEITFETPWRGTLADPENDGDYALTTDGKPHSGREPIDLDGLLAELADSTDPRAALPDGTRIGHVHVHVTDLDDAMHFYRDLIGFGGVFLLRSWGMGDVGLDYMPHAIAFNIWAGPNAQRPPDGTAGLRHFTIVVPDSDTREAMAARLAAAHVEVSRNEDKLIVEDPSGNRIHVEVAA